MDFPSSQSQLRESFLKGALNFLGIKFPGLSCSKIDALSEVGNETMRGKSEAFQKALSLLKFLFMGRIRITKQFSFEAGHALFGYDGKCKNVHGHSYKLAVTVIGEPISDEKNVKWGMVIDFGDLKKIVKQEIVDKFDHATVFNQNTAHVELAEELQKRGHSVILVDYQPTSENMIQDFAEKIKKRLPQNIELYSLRLQETETSYAEWFAADNC